MTLATLQRSASDLFRKVSTVGAGVTAVALLAGSAATAEPLRIATPDLPPAFGDPQSSSSFQFLYVYQSLFDALVTVDGKGIAKPALAVSWENKAPDVWHFRLRPDVIFHNGQPFNADAIVSAVNYMMSDEGKTNSVYGSLRFLAGASKIDDLTVEIRSNVPTPILPHQMSVLKIVEPKAWAELGKAEFSKNPSGTGPFRVTKWDRERIESARFKDAWRLAKLDGVTWLELPEPAARVQAFASGQIDVALALSADSQEAVERAGGRLNAGPTPSNAVFMFNMARPGPAQDVRVRQAFNYALDKSFVDTLFHGLAAPASQPAARSVQGYQDDIKAYPFDLEKAKQLLAEAGYPDGLDVVGEIVMTLPDLVNVQQLLSASLKKIGVNLELRVITLPDLIARVTGAKEIEGELFVFNFGAAPSGDMMRSINAFHSCGFARQWTCFPEIEPTIKMVNEEFDPAKRAAGLRKVAQYYHENAPAVWLFEQVELDAVAAKVKNYRNENWIISFTDMELTD